MRFRGDKRIYILVIASTFVVIGVLWLWLGPRQLTPAEAADRIHEAGEKLASDAGTISVSVNVVLPEQLGGTQSFEGSGAVDFDQDLAALTYDFGEIVNAGGGFGALQEFDVVLDGGTVYVEIFPDGPPWISFTPDQSSRRDVERLRELVLASPLVLPDLLQGSGSASGTESWQEVQLRGLAGSALLLRATTESSSAMFPLLDELTISEVPIDLKVTPTLLTIDYEVSFPISGGPDRIVVQVSTEFERGDPPPIDPPAGSEVRDFEELFD